MSKFLGLIIGLSLIAYSLFTVNDSDFITRLNGRGVKYSALRNLPPGNYTVDLILDSLPKRFVFKVDDCIKSMQVNGHEVTEFNFPYCNYQNTTSISLRDFNSLPLNKITVVVENLSGPGSFTPFLDKVTYRQLRNYLLFTFGFLILAYLIIHRRWSYHYYAVLVPTLLSRAAIAALLPLDTRSSDFLGHVEHAAYVLQNYKIPITSRCWECYQPPAFYYLNAAFDSLFRIDIDNPQALGFFPLILSLFSTLISIELFKTWITRKWGVLFLLPFLLLPGLLNTEISFNNDSLATFASLLILLFGSIHYKRSKLSVFWLGTLCLPLGILSKLSVAASVSWWFLILLAKGSYRRIIYSGLITTLLVAPYFLYRRISDGSVKIIGNIQSLNSQMAIDVTSKTFYSLDIISMIKNPFADPWIDGFHRHSFGEYAFLTGIFFEAKRLPLTPSQISVALLLISTLATIFYFIIDIRTISKGFWPIIVAVILYVLSLATNLAMHPFACCANYRFIAPVSTLLGILFAAVLINRTKVVKFGIFSSTIFGVLFAWIAILSLGS